MQIKSNLESKAFKIFNEKFYSRLNIRLIPVDNTMNLPNPGQILSKYQNEINKSKEYTMINFADYDLDVLTKTLGICFMRFIL